MFCYTVFLMGGMVIYNGPHRFHVTITAVDMYTLDSDTAIYKQLQ